MFFPRKMRLQSVKAVTSANGRARDDENMVGSFSGRSRIVRALEMTFHVFFVVPWGFIFRGRGSIW